MTASEAVDLELAIRAEGIAYRADIRLAQPSSQADSVLATNVPITLDPTALLPLMIDPTAYGHALTTQLFSKDSVLTSAWRDARKVADGAGLPLRLRLRISSTAVAIHHLRWETLHDPLTNLPLATDARLWLVRYLDSHDTRAITLKSKPALRALLVVANPGDLAEYGMAEIDVEGEVRRVRNALGSIALTVIGDVEGAVSRRASLGAVREALRLQPTIFCLVCHGMHVDDDTMLWLEDDVGKTALVKGSKLSQIFDQFDHPPLLAVLIACEGGGDGYHQGPLAALGPRLALGGVGAILAMQAKLSMDAVTRLLPVLFEEVIRDGRIDRAVSIARASLSDHNEWWMPALWLRVKDGRLWHTDEPATQQPNLYSQLNQAESRITTILAEESSFVVTEIRQQGVGLHARLDDLPAMGAKLDAIMSMLAREEKSLPNTGAQSALETQIEIARKLVRERRFVAARGVVEDLQVQFDGSEITPDLRARMANILGACAFAIGELQNAQNYFDEAIALAPTNVSMLTNSAMVALVSDRSEMALELSKKARGLDGKDPSALSVYIQALYHLGKQEELEHILRSEASIAEYPVVIAALASIKSAQGCYVEAEDLLRKSIAIDANDPQLYILLASTIFASLTSTMSRINLDDELVVARLREAEQAFSQAVTICEKGEERASLHAALVSRAGIRYAQDELNLGLVDCDRVLSEDATNRGALENKGRILLELGRGIEAVACFEKILDESIDRAVKPSRYKLQDGSARTPSVSVLLACAYIDSGQINKAINLLESLFTASPEDKGQIGIAELLLLAQNKAHNQHGVSKMLEIIEEKWKEDPQAKAIRAEYYAYQGDNTRAVRLFREADEKASDYLHKKIVSRIAYLLYKEAQYSEAVEVLRPIIDKRRDNQDLRLYIVCLFNSQQFGEALSLAQFVRSTKGIVPGLSEVEAQILERGGDVLQAREIWRQLIQIEPGNISYRVQAAYTEWRLGNSDTARQLTLGVSYDVVRNNATLLINLARLRNFLKLPDVLVFAYQARRIAFDNPDIHVQYMMLCLHVEEPERSDAQLMPEVVGVHSAVSLARNGKTTTFLIVDDDLTQKHQNELHVSDPLAQKLLGRRVGERVALKEGFFGSSEYEISEIKGRYIHASHETTHLFAQGILRHQAFYVGDVGESDFIEQFTRFLDYRSQSQPDIRMLYTKQSLPLTTFAQMINRSVIDVWMAFIEAPDERIFSAFGSTDEAEAQHLTLASSTSIVIDLVSLLTIIHLSLEEVIAQRFSAILMPQALLDDLYSYEHELTGPQPYGTIGSFAGQRYFTETPTEYFRKKHDLIHKALKFVREKAQIRPTMELVVADQDIIEVLGEATAASILLAKEQNIPLYSDDLRVRILAHQQWGVNGFDSQTVLRDIYGRSMLSASDYYKAVIRLVQSNYHYIRVDAEGLIFVLEQNSMTITKEAHALFRLTQGPDCDQGSAIQVVAELIKQVWIRSVPQHQKLLILDLALTSLFTGRKSSVIIPELKAQLWQNFRLIEFLLVDVFEHIDYWRRHTR